MVQTVEGKLVVARTDAMALRWMIGGEMAHLREQSGLSLTEVAAEVGLTKTKLNHMENGRSNQAPVDIAAVLEACGTPQTDIERITNLASRLHGRPWWTRWKTLVPDWYGLFLGLEGMADHIFVYELAAVPGLLQTNGYATAVTSQARLVSQDDAHRFVELRMARAERLTSEPMLDYHAVIDEAALRRTFADRDVVDEQLQHLLMLSEYPNVTLQVLETARGLHGGIGMGNYAIVDIDGLGGVAYAELYGDALFIRQPDKVSSYRMAAEHSSTVALSPDDTRVLIEDMRTTLR